MLSAPEPSSGARAALLSRGCAGGRRGGGAGVGERPCRHRLALHSWLGGHVRNAGAGCDQKIGVVVSVAFCFRA